MDGSQYVEVVFVYLYFESNLFPFGEFASFSLLLFEFSPPSFRVSLMCSSGCGKGS
jgi:hypothetical protein